MPNTRDIRRRIRSVKNTSQITRAMQLVAASKMKRAQDMALQGRPYATLLAEILSALGERVTDFEHPFLKERDVRRRGILLISTDKGLCGPLNSNLFRELTEVEEEAQFVASSRCIWHYVEVPCLGHYQHLDETKQTCFRREICLC